MKFIDLTRNSDGEKVHINVAFIVSVYPCYGKPSVTVLDCMCNNGGYGYEVKESVDEVMRVIKGGGA